LRSGEDVLAEELEDGYGVSQACRVVNIGLGEDEGVGVGVGFGHVVIVIAMGSYHLGSQGVGTMRMWVEGTWDGDRAESRQKREKRKEKRERTVWPRATPTWAMEVAKAMRDILSW
jgi:hypothetical protein